MPIYNQVLPLDLDFGLPLSTYSYEVRAASADANLLTPRNAATLSVLPCCSVDRVRPEQQSDFSKQVTNPANQTTMAAKVEEPHYLPTNTAWPICSICCEAFSFERIPLLLLCCENSVCIICFENRQASELAELDATEIWLNAHVLTVRFRKTQATKDLESVM
eukprot:scaffold3621_cov115-Skeletonema_dohrnii-CCMP3373.AAC.10